MWSTQTLHEHDDCSKDLICILSVVVIAPFCMNLRQMKLHVLSIRTIEFVLVIYMVAIVVNTGIEGMSTRPLSIFVATCQFLFHSQCKANGIAQLMYLHKL